MIVTLSRVLAVFAHRAPAAAGECRCSDLHGLRARTDEAERELRSAREETVRLRAQIREGRPQVHGEGDAPGPEAVEQLLAELADLPIANPHILAGADEGREYLLRLTETNRRLAAVLLRRTERTGVYDVRAWQQREQEVDDDGR